jgi:hypothetical protein
VNAGAMVWLEGLGKLKKKSITSSGLEPATIWLEAQRLNHLCYRVPQIHITYFIYLLLTYRRYH